MRSQALLFIAVAAGITACSRELVVVRSEQQSRAPVIDQLSPLAGVVAQTVVRLEGRNFTSDARVFFGSVEGIWAVGPDYAHSDTVLYALPPSGSPAEAEVSVRTAAGEGVAGQFFRVFESEPEITGLSAERVTATTKLVISGSSFNPEDVAAHLALGAARVLDFTVETSRITADLRATAGFTTVGHGWKILRYRYTPYVDGGNDEAAIPVYVVQVPQIVRINSTVMSGWGSARAFAGELVELEVRNFDDYRGTLASVAQDNVITVGGIEASIESVSVNRELGTHTLLVRLPRLAEGDRYPVVITNLAGKSVADVSIDISGQGHPRTGAQLAQCAPIRPRSPGVVYFDDTKVGHQRLAYVDDDWEARAFFTTGAKGHANQLWTSARLAGAFEPMYVRRVSSLPAVGSGQHEDYFVALLANAPGLSSDPADDPISQWQLAVIYRDSARVFPLPGVSQPSSTRWGGGSGLKAHFVRAHPDSPNTFGLWFSSEGAEDDQLFLITAPPPASFDDPLATLSTAAVSLPPNAIRDARLWRDNAATETFVAVMTSSSTRTYRIPDAAPRMPVLLGSVAMQSPLALEQYWSMFYVIDAVDGMANARLHLITPTPYSASFSNAARAISTSPNMRPRLVNGRWWLGESYDPRLYHVDGWGGGAIDEVVLPPGFYPQDVLVSSYSVLGALTQGNGALAIGLADDPMLGKVVSYQALVTPLTYVQPLAQRSYYDNGSITEVFSEQSILRVEHNLWRAEEVPYRLTAQQVLPTSHGPVVLSLQSDAAGDPTRYRRHGVVWAGSFSLDGDVLYDGASRVVFESGASTPIAMALVEERGYATERLLVLGYGATQSGDDWQQTVILSQTTTGQNGEVLHCPVATASALVPDEAVGDFSVAKAIAMGGVDARITLVDFPAEAPCTERWCRRAFVSVRGEYWSDVFEVMISDLGNSGCPPAPVAMTSIFDPTDTGGRIFGVSIDRRGRLLAVARAYPNNSEGDVAVASVGTSAPPYVFHRLNADPYYGARDVVTNGSVVMRTTRAGTLVADTVTLTAGGGVVARQLYQASMPIACGYGSCELAFATPDASQVWLARSPYDRETRAWDRFFQYDVSSGVLESEVSLTDRYAVGVSFSEDGDELLLVTTQTSNLDAPLRLVAEAGADVCYVR